MGSYRKRVVAAIAVVSLMAAAGCDDMTGPFDDEEPLIVFASNRDGNFEIYTMDSDGSDQERLTNTANAVDNHPVWTPDGDHIVFTSDRGGNFDIWIMEADGDDPRNVTAAAGIDDNPSISPDGSRIAFSSDRDGNREIYVMNTDGTGTPVRLTTNAAADNAPAWSPDGLRIAFQSTRGDGLADDIFVMNVDGTNVLRLTTDAGPDESPAWVHSGTSIVFATSRTGDMEIFSMNPDGSLKINLTTNSASDTQPFYPATIPLCGEFACVYAALIWTSTRDSGTGEIYITTEVGPARLTNNSFVDENPALK